LVPGAVGGTGVVGVTGAVGVVGLVPEPPGAYAIGAFPEAPVEGSPVLPDVIPVNPVVVGPNSAQVDT
jgi:hypothetical protein